MATPEQTLIERVAHQHAEATLNHYAHLIRDAAGATVLARLWSDGQRDQLAAVIANHLANIDLSTTA